MKKPKTRMARAKALVASIDPPITPKERTYIRRFRLGVMLGAGFAQEVKDPGVGSMADEIAIVFEENVPRFVQAYRDGKTQ